MTTTKLSDPFLDENRQALDGIIAETQEILEHVSAETLARRPANGGWNAIECYEHLHVSGELYYPRIRQACERARQSRRKRRGEFKSGFVGGIFAKLLAPESTFKAKAPKKFRIEPSETGLNDVGLIERFITQQREFAETIAEIDGFDIRGVKFRNPAAPLIRFSIGDGILIMVRHMTRHHEQAKRAIADATASARRRSSVVTNEE